MRIKKLLHIHGIHLRWNIFLVNKVYAGTKPKYFERKRNLLNAIGCQIGEGTKIVGPIYCFGTLIIGKNCWIGKNLIINGIGKVSIGDNCDIAPEVTFLTGGHEIGTDNRRAGKGQIYTINVGSGTWIGARSTIMGDISIGNSCVIGACSLVNKDIENNALIAGIPARLIRKLADEK